MTASGRTRIDAFAEADLACHASALQAAARALCRDAVEREDLIQDAFERALRYLDAGKAPVRNVRAWLVTILRNAFIDRIRAEPPPFMHDVEDYATPDPDPQPSWCNVTAAEVRAACVAIQPELRVIFELHYLDGLRYKEIAAQLAIPENTVASRLFRARAALRHQLLAPRARESGEQGPVDRSGDATTLSRQSEKTCLGCRPDMGRQREHGDRHSVMTWWACSVAWADAATRRAPNCQRRPRPARG
jgi:RNA polymerase sigma-70 factor, ECF subfamily